MATVDLRAVARAAWEAKESDRVTSARTALGEVIGAENAADTALDVAGVDESASGYTVTFVDAAGVRLAVQMRDGGAAEVWLLVDNAGTWEPVARVESLAHLWRLIDEHLPADAVPAWDVQVAYAVGDQVTYGGDTYEAIQAHTSTAGWEPPNVPALWVKVV